MSSSMTHYSTEPESPLADYLSKIPSLQQSTPTVSSTVPQQQTDADKIVRAYLENKKDQPPMLIIMTPCYGGVVCIDYTISLINTIALFNAYGIKINVVFCKNDSLVTRARNNLIAKAMCYADATHFIFIDADIKWNPFDVIKLMIDDKELIGGVYPLKAYRWDNLLSQKGTSLSTLFDIKREQHEWNKKIPDLDILKSILVKYNFNPINVVLEIKENLAVVRHLATGFMMMKRQVITKLIDAYPESKFRDDIGFLNTEEENRWAYGLFSCGVQDQHYLSEDWVFCDKYLKLDTTNNKIYIDVSVNLTHTGTEEYSASLLSSF